jgi:sugar phosphate permease
LLARAVPAGLLVSALCWFVASFVPYLGFFVAILVGVAVSQVMGRLALRRSIAGWRRSPCCAWWAAW